MSVEPLMRLDPDGLRYIATILIWAHWFVVAFSLVQMAYRPAGWPECYVVYAPLFMLLVAFNGMTHYRLATKRTITWRWILAFAAMDVRTVSVATASKTCGRTPGVWADASSLNLGDRTGRERDLCDAIGSQRAGGLGCQQSLVA